VKRHEILKGGKMAVEVANPGGSMRRVEAAAVDHLLATSLGGAAGVMYWAAIRESGQSGMLRSPGQKER
jgi:hypothetical protein